MLLSLGFSLFISLVASNSLSFFGGDQTILDGDLAVPGNNPLEYCNANDKSILIIENVDLDPNPPKPSVRSLPPQLSLPLTLFLVARP